MALHFTFFFLQFPFFSSFFPLFSVSKGGVAVRSPLSGTRLRSAQRLRLCATPFRALFRAEKAWIFPHFLRDFPAEIDAFRNEDARLFHGTLR